MQRGSVGARNLNDVSAKRFQPAAARIRRNIIRGPITFRVGDRVMQRVNNYDKNVFNGDVGLYHPSTKKTNCRCPVPRRPVEYEFADMDQLVHAFSLTVHKCIAEYERVWTTERGLVPIKDLAVGDCVQTGRDGARRVSIK